MPKDDRLIKEVIRIYKIIHPFSKLIEKYEKLMGHVHKQITMEVKTEETEKFMGKLTLRESPQDAPLSESKLKVSSLSIIYPNIYFLFLCQITSFLFYRRRRMIPPLLVTAPPAFNFVDQQSKYAAVARRELTALRSVKKPTGKSVEPVRVTITGAAVTSTAKRTSIGRLFQFKTKDLES